MPVPRAPTYLWRFEPSSHPVRHLRHSVNQRLSWKRMLPPTTWNPQFGHRSRLYDSDIWSSNNALLMDLFSRPSSLTWGKSDHPPFYLWSYSKSLSHISACHPGKGWNVSWILDVSKIRRVRFNRLRLGIFVLAGSELSARRRNLIQHIFVRRRSIRFFSTTTSFFSFLMTSFRYVLEKRECRRFCVVTAARLRAQRFFGIVAASADRFAEPAARRCGILTEIMIIILGAKSSCSRIVAGTQRGSQRKKKKWGRSVESGFVVMIWQLWEICISEGKYTKWKVYSDLESSQRQ